MTQNEDRRPLAPGEIRRTAVGGQLFQVMHVAGGSFTQATGGGKVLCTSPFADVAVKAYADAVEAAQQQKSDEADALDGDEEPMEPLTAEGASALAVRAGFAPVVIIRAIVEDMIGTTQDMEIPRAEWDAMTPAQRNARIDEFGAETMNSCGGYGASILSGAPDSDLVETPAPLTVERDCTHGDGCPVHPDTHAVHNFDGPEHAAYAAELKVELGKFARGEDPYPFTDVLTGPVAATFGGAVVDPADALPTPAPTLADDVAALREKLLTTRMGGDKRDELLAALDRIAARAPWRATDRNGWPLKMCTACRHITAESREACRSCGHRASQPLYIIINGGA